MIRVVKQAARMDMDHLCSRHSPRLPQPRAEEPRLEAAYQSHTLGCPDCVQTGPSWQRAQGLYFAAGLLPSDASMSGRSAAVWSTATVKGLFDK